MGSIATLDDIRSLEREMPWDARVSEKTIYAKLQSTAKAHGNRPALSFQIKSGPKDKAETFTWEELRGQGRTSGEPLPAVGRPRE